MMKFAVVFLIAAIAGSCFAQKPLNTDSPRVRFISRSAIRDVPPQVYALINSLPALSEIHISDRTFTINAGAAGDITVSIKNASLKNIQFKEISQDIVDGMSTFRVVTSSGELKGTVEFGSQSKSIDVSLADASVDGAVFVGSDIETGLPIVEIRRFDITTAKDSSHESGSHFEGLSVATRAHAGKEVINTIKNAAITKINAFFRTAIQSLPNNIPSPFSPSVLVHWALLNGSPTLEKVEDAMVLPVETAEDFYGHGGAQREDEDRMDVDDRRRGPHGSNHHGKDADSNDTMEKGNEVEPAEPHKPHKPHKPHHGGDFDKALKDMVKGTLASITIDADIDFHSADTSKCTRVPTVAAPKSLAANHEISEVMISDSMVNCVIESMFKSGSIPTTHDITRSIPKHEIGGTYDIRVIASVSNTELPFVSFTKGAARAVSRFSVAVIDTATEKEIAGADFDVLFAAGVHLHRKNLVIRIKELTVVPSNARAVDSASAPLKALVASFNDASKMASLNSFLNTRVVDDFNKKPLIFHAGHVPPMHPPRRPPMPEMQEPGMKMESNMDMAEPRSRRHPHHNGKPSGMKPGRMPEKPQSMPGQSMPGQSIPAQQMPDHMEGHSEITLFPFALVRAVRARLDEQYLHAGLIMRHMMMPPPPPPPMPPMGPRGDDATVAHESKVRPRGDGIRKIMALGMHGEHSESSRPHHGHPPRRDFGTDLDSHLRKSIPWGTLESVACDLIGMQCGSGLPSKSESAEHMKIKFDKETSTAFLYGRGRLLLRSKNPVTECNTDNTEKTEKCLANLIKTAADIDGKIDEKVPSVTFTLPGGHVFVNDNVRTAIEARVVAFDVNTVIALTADEPSVTVYNGSDDDKNVGVNGFSDAEMSVVDDDEFGEDEDGKKTPVIAIVLGACGVAMVALVAVGVVMVRRRRAAAAQGPAVFANVVPRNKMAGNMMRPSAETYDALGSGSASV